MEKFDYRVVQLIGTPMHREELLQELGEQGWELMKIVETPDFGPVAYMKKAMEG